MYTPTPPRIIRSPPRIRTVFPLYRLVHGDRKTYTRYRAFSDSTTGRRFVRKKEKEIEKKKKNKRTERGVSERGNKSSTVWIRAVDSPIGRPIQYERITDHPRAESRVRFLEERSTMTIPGATSRGSPKRDASASSYNPIVFSSANRKKKCCPSWNSHARTHVRKRLATPSPVSGFSNEK